MVYSPIASFSQGAPSWKAHAVAHRPYRVLRKFSGAGTPRTSAH